MYFQHNEAMERGLIMNPVIWKDNISKEEACKVTHHNGKTINHDEEEKLTTMEGNSKRTALQSA